MAETMIELEEVAGNRPVSSDDLEVSLRAAADEQQYQRDWEDPESDNDIVIPAARMTKDQPKRKITLTNLMQETKLRGWNTSMRVAVHNLSFSLDITAAKSTTPTVWNDIKEKWKVDKKEKITKKVLHNVSFVIQEKMMILLLGTPGCGKTSLMKLLANDMPYGRAQGDMFFNKKPIDPDTHHQNVSYVTQEDAHAPSLTVKQTLEFAGQLLLDKNDPSMENVSVSDIADVVMQLLGLSHRANTIVGNDMIRGVSGGEKKRVTIGIELMKRPKFLLLDEATTGLDTSRSVELGKFCRVVADNFVPVIAALLQPPFRLYKRFDHILLMHNGRVAYFGERTKVLEYFEEIGFRCPNWMNPADFLVAVLVRPDDFRFGDERYVETDDDFADIYAQSSMYRNTVLPMIRDNYPDGLEPEEEPQEYVKKKKGNPLVRLRNSFTSGSFAKESKDESKEESKEEIKDEGEEGDDEDQEMFSPQRDDETARAAPFGRKQGSFVSERRPNLAMKSQIDLDPPEPAKFATPRFFQFKMLTKRGFLTTKNFPAMLIFVSMYGLFLATFYGTLFFQLGYYQSDLSLRAGIVFNIVMILGFQANKSNDILFQGREVFQLQRAKRYFSTFPYFVAGLVHMVPNLILDVSLFASVAYWLIGLSDQDGGARFIFIILVGVLLQLACDGWVRFIGQINSSYVTAQGMGPFTLGGFILLAGFFRRIDEIPWAVRWLSYLSPFRWAYEASLINELGGQAYECRNDELVPPANDPALNEPYSDGGYDGSQVCPVTNGDQYLLALGLETDQSWKWYCVLFLVLLGCAFQTMFFLALKYVKHEKPEMLRQKYKKEEEEEGEGEWLLDVDSKIDTFPPEELEEKRAAKPRVYLEVKKMSYSVEGVAETPNDEESQMGGGSGGESSAASDLLEEEETKNGAEEGEYGDLGLMNKIGGSVSQKCSCCPCFPARMDLKLLDSVSLNVEPGMMMALMGPSGAGKSTLMDVIAGRKTAGAIEGEILFNGRERDEYFCRYTGYCEQRDLHMTYATVWEAVKFSAFTRLPASWSKKEKLSNVRDVIDRLRLASVSHVLVKNLRLEQRKRLTVAVELVTNPSVLFLDEPTSGLDTTEASEIIKIVKEEAEKGMSVVCTIHQPSSQIFSLFSHMLLLKRGGKVVFDGHVDEMKDYFQSQLGLRMPAYENPADFALEVASIEDGPNDPAEMWASFARQREAQAEVNKEMGGSSSDLSRKPSMTDRMSNARIAEYDSKYPASFTVQCKEILARAMKSHLRRPQDFRVRMIRNLIMGLIAGVVFWDAGDGQSGPQTRLSSFFFLLIMATLNSFTQVTLIILDRPAFYRERLSGSYRALVYLLGLILPDLPLQLAAFLLFAVPQYFMAGFLLEPEAIFYYFVVGFGACVLSFSLVNLIAVAAFNAPVGTLLAGVTITISNMLAGFFIPKDEIPPWWIWGYYVSFVRYPLEGLTVNELEGMEFNCGSDGTEGAVPVPVGTDGDVQYYCPLTNGDQLIDSLSMSSSHKWPYLGVTYGMVLMFVVLTWLALVKIVHISR